MRARTSQLTSGSFSNRAGGGAEVSEADEEGSVRSVVGAGRTAVPLGVVGGESLGDTRGGGVVPGSCSSAAALGEAVESRPCLCKSEWEIVRVLVEGRGKACGASTGDAWAGKSPGILIESK